MSVRQDVDVNRPLSIFSIALLASVTPSAVLLGPLIVGALVTDLGFSPQAGGNMIFAELTGAAVATFPAFWWLTRVNWRRVLYISLVVTIVGNLVSATIVDPWTLGAVRFVTGLGVGTIMLVTMTTTGLTANQERVFGFWQTGQIIFAAAALAAIPFVLPVLGLAGIYVGLAVVMTLLGLAVRNFPSGGDAAPGFSWGDFGERVKRLAPIALIGLILFYIAVGGVWNFVERMGNAAGFEPRFIGYTLSGVSVVGVAGALTATWLSTRLGRVLPFVSGLVVIAVSFVILYGLSSRTVFILSAFLFKYGWWFVSPYLLANITTLDPSGRLIIATNFTIAFGQALGPLVVGFMLVADVTGQVLDYSPALSVGLVCLALCAFLFYPVTRANQALLESSESEQPLAAES